ncbi:MAG TPA: glycosyltransferase family 39 protein, partial [Chloroflexota bacterium]|nr:glycosyltransferase family 39 protein [Chloroflexota bacterium]
MSTGATLAPDPAAQRGLRRAAGWLLERAPQQVLPPVSVWELARVCLAIAAGVCAHAWNLFNYPRYQQDEGVYISAAWAVTHGQIYPYTYNYGHPPLGWALLAAWCQLTGGFVSFGTAIATGRVFMLAIYAVSALFVYLIARRLSGSAAAALLATTLFSFSPLSIYFQRWILLDNIATFWILLALYLQVASASRMRYIVGSALAFGICVLSKETMIVFFPVLVYGTWLQASTFQRRYVLITFSYLALALVSAFVLLAALKNELFPTGTLLGGTRPHVSMITTYLQQAGRGTIQGSFLEQWGFWQHADGLLMVAGVIAMAGNLLLGRRRPALRVVTLLLLIYFLFLARGGVTFAYYVIPLVPLLALNVALLAHSVISLVARVPWCANLVLARWIAPAAIVTCMALLLPYDMGMNRTNVTANETGPQVAALQWMGQHVLRSARVIANHYEWLDLRADGGLGVGYGAPFDHVEMYWIVATDPAIGSGVFHNDWNNVDYIMVDHEMILDANNFHMKLLLGALKHAIPIKTFQNRLYWVTIYQVQHRNSLVDMGGPSPGGPSPGQEMTLPIISNGPTTLYFAEGYTGRLSTTGRAAVDESLAMHSASPFPATVTITYLFEHGSPVVVTRTIGPDATLRESVNAD